MRCQLVASTVEHPTHLAWTITTMRKPARLPAVEQAGALPGLGFHVLAHGRIAP